nr:MAG TPA: Excisionase [Caudoviricetes sp.]
MPMDNPFKPLADQFDSMLTAVIADKTKAFDLDETLHKRLVYEVKVQLLIYSKLVKVVLI